MVGTSTYTERYALSLGSPCKCDPPGGDDIIGRGGKPMHNWWRGYWADQCHPKLCMLMDPYLDKLVGKL
jgi:hypothetical protein